MSEEATEALDVNDDQPEVNAEAEGDQVEDTAEEATNSESGDDAPAEDTEAKKPRGVQKRIDELTSNWRSTERDRDYWRDLAVNLQKGGQQQQKPETPEPQPATSERPNSESFESYDDYLEALADWKLETREAKRQAELQDQERTQTEKERAEQFQSRAKTFAEKHPDYEAVVGNPSLQISTAMAEAIMATDRGPEVAYELGRNPTEAARIAALSPVQAALELGRIEARLSVAATKKVTAAPDPVKPKVGGGGTPAALTDEISVKDWMEQRNRQLRQS